MFKYVKRYFDRRHTRLPKQSTALIKESFDAKYYLQAYPDVADSRVNPFKHFINTGWSEGRSPNKFDKSSTAIDCFDHLGHPLDIKLIKLLKESFDPGFYRTTYTDVTFSGMDPFRHFMQIGWREGRNPNENFSTRNYAFLHSEHIAKGENPFIHWLRRKLDGLSAESLEVIPEQYVETFYDQYGEAYPQDLIVEIQKHFDSDFYLIRNDTIRLAEVDPFSHFMENGWREHRDPNSLFSIEDYLVSNTNFIGQDENPLVHWVRSDCAAHLFSVLPAVLDQYGNEYPQSLIIEVHKHFDSNFYLVQNEDIRLAEVDPFSHFMENGWREHRDPSPSFSIEGYLANNTDIVGQGENPLVHWVRSDCEAHLLPLLPSSKSPEDYSLSQFNFTEKHNKTALGYFDSDFYVSQVPDVDFSVIDPFAHYMIDGWHRKLNPSSKFSTQFYLENNPDLLSSGSHPFEHFVKFGRAEKRDSMPYSELRAQTYEPLVSVIVPNYNHAKFLEERIASIENQTYNNIELILLDDCSRDESRKVLSKAAEQSRFKVKKYFNRKNAGNVFKQWGKGLSLAEGELVWICESDDFCEPDFLENLVPHFADLSVMIAFGKIQFSNSNGEFMPGMDGFRENSESGIWDDVLKRPAKQWFQNGFGVNNVMANVGGGVFRNQPISKDLIADATTYKIAGDWYLYSHLANGGQIVFDPKSVSYFRQHDSNTSATNFNKLYYYNELGRILAHNESRWGLPKATREKFVANVTAQWVHFGMEEKYGDIRKEIPIFDQPLEGEAHNHIVLAFLGFHSGGGEVFPIHLANHYAGLGKTVSMVAFTLSEINEDMLGLLDKRVAVYSSNDVKHNGANLFLNNIGGRVVHSHMVSLDDLFFNKKTPLKDFPYVVSLHGSHDTLGPGREDFLAKCRDGVTLWAYTADKNLKIFDNMPIDGNRLVKFENAMPPDSREFEQTRSELGIEQDAVVFTFVARGIQRKGWRAAIAAFSRLQKEHKGQKSHLILVGDGPKKDEMYKLHKDTKNISFLGFQSRINGIYRMSDCAIVPTRFGGESSPLCILQAMNEGLPLIATDVGEISNLLSDKSKMSGILIPNTRNSDLFFEQLFTAMYEMMDEEVRHKYAKASKLNAKRFSMKQVAGSYLDFYEQACDIVDNFNLED